MSTQEFNDTAEVLAAIAAAKSIAELGNVLQTALARDGFDAFAFLNGYSNGVPSESVIASFSREWRDQYISQQYLAIDPIARAMVRINRPFVWSDVEAVRGGIGSNLTEQQKMMRAAYDHGYQNGFVFPLHLVDTSGARYSSGLSLVWTGGNSGFRDVVGRREQHYKAVAHSMAVRLQDIAVEFEHGEAGDLYLIDNPLEKKGLTGRERDVLSWAARGKTVAETAVILGLSYDTVSHHMQNMQRKLGAANATHAVALAVLRGMVTP